MTKAVKRVHKRRGGPAKLKRQFLHTPGATLDELARATYLNETDAMRYYRHIGTLAAFRMKMCRLEKRIGRRLKIKMNATVLYMRRDVDEALNPSHGDSVAR